MASIKRTAAEAAVDLGLLDFERAAAILTQYGPPLDWIAVSVQRA